MMRDFSLQEKSKKVLVGTEPIPYTRSGVLLLVEAILDSPPHPHPQKNGTNTLPVAILTQ